MSPPFFEKPDLERDLEAEFVEFVESRGWLQTKFTSPSRTGFPDRFLARKEHSQGRVVMCELKRSGEPPTKKQLKVHRDLMAAGVEVYVIDNMELARNLFY